MANEVGKLLQERDGLVKHAAPYQPGCYHRRNRQDNDRQCLHEAAKFKDVPDHFRIEVIEAIEAKGHEYATYHQCPPQTIRDSEAALRPMSFGHQQKEGANTANEVNWSFL